MSTVIRNPLPAPTCVCESSIEGGAGTCGKCGKVILVPLSRLARDANAEHQMVRRAASVFLVHAIKAGDALRQAREQVPRGTWLAWVDENFRASAYTANIYMRFALHKDSLLGRATGWDDAVQIIREIDGNPAPRSQRDTGRQQKALALRAEEGLSYAQIGQRLGIDGTTAYRDCNPEQMRNEPSRQRARTGPNLKRLNTLVDDSLASARRGLERMPDPSVKALLEDVLAALTDADELLRTIGETDRHLKAVLA